MIIHSLSLENFMRYRRRCSLTFEGRRTIGIVGENESGKSSLLQAISYGLYGVTRAERPIQLINDHATGDLLVELSIRFPDDALLEITRGRTARNEPILKVAGLGDLKAHDAQQHIAELVQLQYDDFIALTYFMQGDLHQFMTGNKRAYFQRWTAGLRLWKRYEEAASALVLQNEERIAKARFELEQCKEALRGEEQVKSEGRAAQVELQRAKAAVKLVREQVSRLQRQYKALAARGDRHEVKVNPLRQQLHNAKTELRMIERDLQSHKTAQSAAASNNCPILEGVHCAKLRQSKEKALKKHARQVVDLSRAHRVAKHRVDSIEQRVSVAVASVQQNFQHDLDQQLEVLERAQQELHEANARQQRASNRLERAKTEYQQLQSYRARMKDVRRDRAVAERDLRRSQFVRYMCGKSGVPSQLIEAELERVEHRCNWVLDRLGYTKQVRFSGYRELASYEKVCPACGSESWHKQSCRDCGAPRPKQRRDEPTVTVLDGMTERPFALESGGAQVLQSFAVRLAAGLFVSSMSGVPMRMVMLDEVFGMLDSSNRQRLLSLVIGKLSEEFGLQQQFVVSHQEDVTNAVDDLLQVRVEGGSAVASWE